MNKELGDKTGRERINARQAAWRAKNDWSVRRYRKEWWQRRKTGTGLKTGRPKAKVVTDAELDGLVRMPVEEPEPTGWTQDKQLIAEMFKFLEGIALGQPRWALTVRRKMEGWAQRAGLARDQEDQSGDWRLL